MAGERCIKQDMKAAGANKPNCGTCLVPDMIIDTFRNKDTRDLSLREQIAVVRDEHCPEGVQPDVSFIRLATLQQVQAERASLELSQRSERLNGGSK